MKLLELKTKLAYLTNKKSDFWTPVQIKEISEGSFIEYA